MAGCILLHLGFIVWQAVTHSPTRNEVAHVPAGLVYLETGEFDLYRVNPPLSRLVQALPVKLAGAACDPLLNLPRRRGVRGEWAAASVFATANPENYSRLFVYARLPGLFWSLLGIAVLRRWCGELYGPPAANLATVLWCFAPNLLAHAALATPDFPCAVMFLVACYRFHRYLRDPSAINAFYAGLVLGLAQLVKFTALVLYPAWGLALILASLPCLRRGTRPAQAGRLATRLTVHSGLAIGLSLCVINLGYLGEGTFTPLGQFDFSSEKLATTRQGVRQNAFAGTFAGSLPVPLPANYVRGLDVQQVDFEKDVKSYLRGEYRQGGWWYFYLYALLVKVPVATLLLAGAAGWLVLFRPPRSGEELAIWIPCLTLFAVASWKTGFTLHFRYVLPALPLALVGLSKAGSVKSRCGAAMMNALALGSVISSLLVAPHWLSYFNVAAGGPDNGSAHLIDSNLDWGQDLYRLNDWIRDHSDARPLHVSYVSYVPRHVISRQKWQAIPLDPARWQPGWYVVDYESIYKRGRRLFLEMEVQARIGYSLNVYFFSREDLRRLKTKVTKKPLPD